MATKRLIANDDNQLQSDDHQPKEKKFRRMPSFASYVIIFLFELIFVFLELVFFSFFYMVSELM